jgi:IS605 OrfB family transposase
MLGKAKRLTDISRMDLSPTLMLRGAKAWLNCPVEIRSAHVYKTNKEFSQGNRQNGAKHRVCSVDVGINTAATVAIVDSTGTVIARKFLTCGRHNDQRDNLGTLVAFHQTLTGRAGPGFCSGLYRRIAGLSLDAARQLAAQIISFALEYQACAIVVEDLKGWRPKARGAQKKRFHRFQHRMLIKHLGFKAQEFGMRVLEIHARGTSRWAFDGSGKVARSKENAQLATFSSGKQYNADLNGALNIAARGLGVMMGIKMTPEGFADEHKGSKAKSQADTGKSSGSVARMPLVLADIWRHSKSKSFGVSACV